MIEQGFIFIIIGIITSALLMAVVSIVVLWVAVESVKLFLISSHKRYDTSHQSTTSTNNFTHRDIIISGICYLYSFINHLIVGFRDIITLIETVPKPYTKQCNQETKKQSCYCSHSNKSIICDKGESAKPELNQKLISDKVPPITPKVRKLE
jgi:hypothetical protein